MRATAGTPIPPCWSVSGRKISGATSRWPAWNGSTASRRLPSARAAAGIARRRSGVEDFLRACPSTHFGDVQPTYRPGVTPASLDEVLPRELTDAMRQGIRLFDARLHGFANPDAVLTGVETRSSSPVRIRRGEDLQSVTLPGLYPCGEGAGYAGGIVSAAVDGVRCAERVLLDASLT